MRIFGKKQRELAGRHLVVGLRHVVVKPDVLLHVERAERTGHTVALAPPEGLAFAPYEHLNVEVTVMNFQLGVGRSFQIDVHHVDEDIVAVDRVPARRQRAEIGGEQVVERLFEAGIECVVTRTVFERIQYHCRCELYLSRTKTGW